MKTELNKPILTTEPHGEQSLRPTEEPSADKVGNRLFELSSNTDDSAIVMTGEELTNLANQWLEYAKTQGTANAEVSGGEPLTQQQSKAATRHPLE